MLIINRIERVMIWIKNLFNSIKLINIDNKIGEFLGVKFMKKIFKLFNNIKEKYIIIK